MFMNPLAAIMAQRQAPQRNQMADSMAALSSQLGAQSRMDGIDPRQAVMRFGVAQRDGESDADYDIRSGAVRAPSQAQRQMGQYGLAARPAAIAPRPQAPAFDAEAFGTFYQGLDDSQRGLIDGLQQSMGYSHQRQMQEMQQRFNPMMGGIMGMAPPQMRGYMPMMQGPMMMGGYMPQRPMYGGNPYMGGMMGMAPPMMQRMAMMPQQMMMQGGYMPQQQMNQQNQMMQQAYAQSQQQMAPPQHRGMNSQGGFGQQQMQQANYGGQAPQPNTQQAVYAQPQAASPFGGAMRGYYA